MNDLTTAAIGQDVRASEILTELRRIGATETEKVFREILREEKLCQTK